MSSIIDNHIDLDKKISNKPLWDGEDGVGSRVELQSGTTFFKPEIIIFFNLLKFL